MATSLVLAQHKQHFSEVVQRPAPGFSMNAPCNLFTQAQKLAFVTSSAHNLP